MANPSMSWNGLSELKKILRSLPDDLAEEAGRVVVWNANAAAGDIRASYPRVSGNLQDGVVVEVDNSFVGSRYGARAIVKSKAPHAYIYEHGTEARHYFTQKGRGVRKAVGRMPAGNIFVPRVIKHRRRMMDELVEFLIRKGLMVRGGIAA
jgi:hypothetical protein